MLLLSWPGLPCVKRIFISEQLMQNINLVLCSPSPRQWTTTAVPFWATGRASRGNTSKCCLRSPRSAGWAPADKLRPSALMTYRLKRCGIHVSGQCHGPTAKTVGKGEKESRRLLLVLSDGGLAPGLCHITLPPNRPQMKDVKSKCGEEGRWRGALQLKRLPSCKLKRHYLLTWRCPLWGCTLWCENTEREKEQKKEKREQKLKKKERSMWSVASTGNSKDKKIVCWHGLETSVVSLCLKNNKWCTFDIMKTFKATFFRENWTAILIFKTNRLHINYNKH